MDKQIIQQNLKNVLTETDFKNLGEKKIGKVEIHILLKIKSF